MRFRTNGLKGMIMGSGRISLLLGWVWLRDAVRARESIGPWHWPAGLRRIFGPKANFK
jgi:hypothetical protein